MKTLTLSLSFLHIKTSQSIQTLTDLKIRAKHLLLAYSKSYWVQAPQTGHNLLSDSIHFSSEVLKATFCLFFSEHPISNNCPPLFSHPSVLTILAHYDLAA